MLTVGALALAGCSASGGESVSADEDQTISVMYASNELSPEQITAFEDENPNIKVEFIEFDQTRLNTMLAAGDPPDFVRGAPSANTFAKGLATSLDDYVADSKVITEDELLPINNNWRWDGKKSGVGSLYGIVKDWSPDATMWQNTALYEQAGVAPLSTTEPVSWDELLDVAKELKAGGVKNGLGVEWAWGLASPMFTMILQQGGTIYNEDLTVADFTSPEAERAFQWFVDYAKADVGPTSLNPLADGSDMNVFGTGEMATTMDGFWFGGGFTGDEFAGLRDTISMTPAPTFGDRVSPSFNGGIGAWIPSASKHKDAAWKFMEYFMAGQPAIDRASSGWGVPSLKFLLDYVPSDFPYQEQSLATAKGEFEFNTLLPDSPYIQAQAWIDTIDAQLQAAIKGEKTVAEATQAVEDEINKLLAQGKDQLG